MISRVRALAGGNINTMMFSADADDTLDAEHIVSEAVLTEKQDSPSTDDAMPAKPYDTDEAGRPLLSVPITTAFDRITDMTGKGNAIAWRKLQSLARDETAPLKTRLERALRADEQTHWQREQERGELDRQSLVKLAISPGYRTPFRVQRMKKGRDAAVSMLIDRSGSMAGKKIELAPCAQPPSPMRCNSSVSPANSSVSPAKCSATVRSNRPTCAHNMKRCSRAAPISAAMTALSNGWI